MEERMRELRGEVEDKAREVTELERELSSTLSQVEEKTRCLTELETELMRLRGEKEQEKEGEKRKEEELQRSLDHSEAVRRSLLEQVERNGEELGKMTDRLAAMDQREREAERHQAEASKLHQMVTYDYNFEIMIRLVIMVFNRLVMYRERRERWRKR